MCVSSVWRQEKVIYVIHFLSVFVCVCVCIYTSGHVKVIFAVWVPSPMDEGVKRTPSWVEEWGSKMSWNTNTHTQREQLSVGEDQLTHAQREKAFKSYC